MVTQPGPIPSLRPDWVRSVIDTWQVSVGTEDDDGGQLLATATQLLARVPPAKTPFEAVFLRGLIAEVLLRRMGSLGLIPSVYVRLLRSASLNGADQQSAIRHNGEHPKVVLALALIAASCERTNLRLREISGAVQMSPWHLSRLLRRDTGVGFATHLRRARVCRGALLLESATKSIKEIAAAVGYKWARDFSRDFARHFGMAPNRWRRLH